MRNSAPTAIQEKGLLIIPGLGRADRLTTVVHNLLILKEHYLKTVNMQWDCVVYVYAPRELTSFWSQTQELQYVRSVCRIIEVPNKKVTENLFMVQPALIDQLYHKVFILLDDQKIVDAVSFNVTKMLHIMKVNGLTVASPMVRVFARKIICILRIDMHEMFVKDSSNNFSTIIFILRLILNYFL